MWYNNNGYILSPSSTPDAAARQRADRCCACEGKFSGHSHMPQCVALCLGGVE
ncbi:hypothetical protein [Ruminococcus sp. FC2018]|uniref:hypothetical protein n=1 Tax=Ruminococcus sp. FC2018 TaxID=1410617 RepID=UPI000A7ED2FF|nr:hypothetical protein [Ruminococcus sp. FC2018]